METIDPVVSGRRQMALDFTPGLTELYDTALAPQIQALLKAAGAGA